MPPSRGRPRRASQELLQEAAFELFQLRGYRATSVEQIARTAGFSRATFFNFFSSKAELFWVETDALIGSLRDALESRLGEGEPPGLREALLDYAQTMSSSAIPWALKNYRLLEAADDLVASGASRVLELNRLFAHYLRQCGAAGQGAGEIEASGAVAGAVPVVDIGVAAAVVQARAAATTALLLTALLGWIDAGVGRGGFREPLQRAFDCDL